MLVVDVGAVVDVVDDAVEAVDDATVEVDAVDVDAVLGVLVTVEVGVAPPQDGAVEGKVQISSSGSKIPTGQSWG